MVLCCFRGQLDVRRQPPTIECAGGLGPATGSKAVGTVEDTCNVQITTEDYSRITATTVSSLRCSLAAVQGPWLSRIQSCVSYVLAACSPVAHVSIFGASPCGTVLVSLGSTSRCPPVAVLSPGQVLAVPPSWLEGGTDCGMAPGPAVAGNSGGLVILEGTGAEAKTARPGVAPVLVWQESGCGEKQAPAPAEFSNSRFSRQHGTKVALSWGAPPSDWAPLLRMLARDAVMLDGVHTTRPAEPAAAGAATSGAPFLAALVPLSLGSDFIGALLLLTAQPWAATAAGAGAGAAAATRRPGSGDWQQEPWLKAELLSGVAAAVGECCVGAHMSEIQRVTATSYELAAAPDVQSLASALSSAVLEALALELHVDFAVRLALVPQAPGTRTLKHCGFLLTEQPPAQPPGAATAAGGLATELLARTSIHGAAARVTAARMLSQHSLAERTLALSSVKLNLGAPSAISADPLSGPFAQQQAVVSSGVHSFMLPSACPRRNGVDGLNRSWKVRPFSLESTLLASLASKAARAPGGMYGQAPSAVGVGVGSAAPSTAFDDPGGALGGGGGAPGNPVSYIRMPTASLAAATAGGGVASCVMAVSPLTCAGGCSLFRVCRTGGTVVPHVHAYVNDTDQPSADVVLMLRTATAGPAVAAASGGAGGAGRAMYPSMAGNAPAIGAAAAGSAPASLVLVMGCVSLWPMENSVRGGHCDDVSLTLSRPPSGSRNGTQSGAQPLPSLPMEAATAGGAVRWPASAGCGGVGAGGGGSGTTTGGGGDASMCVALYLTSQERLPASLLAAARNRALLLLELLLPAAGACLAESAAAELQYLYDAMSGSLNGGGAAGAAFGPSAFLGRPTSLPASRPQPRSPWSPALPTDDPAPCGGGSATVNAAAAILSPVGTATNPVAATASMGNLLPLSSTAVPSPVPGTLSAAALNSGGGGGLTALPPRGSPRDQGLVSATYTRSGAGGGIGAGHEMLDGDCRLLPQLLSVPASHRHSAQDGPSALVSGLGAATQVTLALPSCGGSHTREVSETNLRVPRSRLSHATVNCNQLSTLAATPTGTTALGNTLFNSYNSLMAALMGTGSVTGRATGAGGGAAAAELYASTDPMQSGNMVQGAGTGTTPPGSQPSTAPRRVLVQQSSMPLGHSPRMVASAGGVMPPLSPGAGPGSRAAYRARWPPRRHFSELLTSLPLDVSDTLTVMRTNMDILVSSFWNTLRSQNNDPSPSPHADEDLRFLRLIKVLGGGGCSTVYTGILHGREVAVKVMKAPSSDDDEEEDEDGEAASSGQQQQRRQRERQPQQQDPEQDGENAPGVAVRQAQLRAIMRGARELAVMTSISHPNIVQIYSYHTRVLVLPEEEEPAERPATGGGVAGARAGARAGAGGAIGVAPGRQEQLPRLVPVPVDSTMSLPGPVQTVLIMECCDLGSLADALDSSMFANAIRNAESARWSSRHGLPRRSQTLSQLPTIPADGSAPGGIGSGSGGVSSGSRQGAGRAAGGVGMRAIYMTLLEVALALRHLHSKNLVHCDVKPANVLLKSSASDPRGFTCKLTDFGFVNLLQYQMEDVDDPAAKPSMRYHEPVGTVTHLAPETMVQGSKLEHTVDIFAFGILMWEVYTGKAPYAEHANNNFRDVPYRVVREGMRPVFTSATPPAFKALAQACWSADTARRPSAAVLVASLQRMMDAAARG